MTAVHPPGRFGAIRVEGNQALAFLEKPDSEDAWISSGFFVLEPSVIDLIESDATIWEREPLETLAANGQLSVYRHGGFWQPMDTLRDKRVLEQLWSSGQAPWKVWQ